MTYRNRIVNISIFFIFFLASFIVAELVVRAAPGLFCSGYQPSQNDKIVYELIPNYKPNPLNLKDIRFKDSISPQGLNDRFFSEAKLPHIFRIAIVGDSTSFGWKVERKDSFPKVLETLLNQNKIENTFEVINFSVPGYNTAQECEVIKQKVICFHPDLVILVYCSNDTHVCNLIKTQINFLNYFYNKSYLIPIFLKWVDVSIKHVPNPLLQNEWLLIKKNTLGLFYYNELIYPYPGLEATPIVNGNPPGSVKNVPERYWYMLGYKNYGIHLKAIDTFLSQNNIQFVSTGFFDAVALAINKKVGIKHIFNLSDLHVIKNNRANVMLDPTHDPHLNKKGHLLVAESLYDYLRGMSFLPIK